ncbi:MAG: hypothetical protein WCK58_11280 [Chloroflexota bacterium]
MSGSPVPTTDPLFPSAWVPLAERLCEAYYAEFPETDARYGQRGRDFCVHDNAYLLSWLTDELDLPASRAFGRNVAWLAGILEARGFPMDAFHRNLELMGAAVAELRPQDKGRIDSLLASVTGR